MSAATAFAASGMPGMLAADSLEKASIPISIFSKHLQFLDYDSMAQTAKKIGFDGVDLTVRPRGHVLPEKVSTDLPRAVEAIRKAGLLAEMMTTSITSLDSPHAEHLLKTAAKEGIKYYRMGSIRFKEDLGMLENLKLINKNLKQMEELNRSLGIHGAYQNHAGTHFGSSVWDMHIAMEGIDPQWLGIQYDIKHATAEGGRSWRNGLNLIHERIHTLDIKDFIWQKRKHQWRDAHVPLGSGMVDFHAFFSLLKKYNLSVPISVHYEYDLGGADHGHREIHMPREQIFAAMTRDLTTLRSMLAASGL
ncbi:MAG: sugar phosphate isomerase/epimerase family protein [Bacteroidota bacterium]